MRYRTSPRFLALALSTALLALPFAAQAQSLSDFHNLTPEEKRDYWDSLSEQERQAKREQWRAERDAMTDEDRAAMHAGDHLALPVQPAIDVGDLRRCEMVMPAGRLCGTAIRCPIHHGRAHGVRGVRGHIRLDRNGN